MENGWEAMLSLFKRQQFLCLSVTGSSGFLTDLFCFWWGLLDRCYLVIINFDYFWKFRSQIHLKYAWGGLGFFKCSVWQTKTLLLWSLEITLARLEKSGKYNSEPVGSLAWWRMFLMCFNHWPPQSSDVNCENSQFFEEIYLSNLRTSCVIIIWLNCATSWGVYFVFLGCLA